MNFFHRFHRASHLLLSLSRDPPLPSSIVQQQQQQQATTTTTTATALLPSSSPAVTRGDSVYASYGQIFEDKEEEEEEVKKEKVKKAAPTAVVEDPLSASSQQPAPAPAAPAAPAAPVAPVAPTPAAAVSVPESNGGGGGGPGHILSPSPATAAATTATMPQALPPPISTASTAAAPPPSSTSSPSLPPATVSVSDPVLRSEPSLIPGVSRTYVSYRIVTSFGGGTALAGAVASLPGVDSSSSSSTSSSSSNSSSSVAVRRRFKDVVLLGDALKLAHRGYCIPPRPDRALPLSGVLAGGSGGNVSAAAPQTPSSATSTSSTAATTNAAAAPRYSASVVAPDSSSGSSLVGGLLGANNTDPAFVEARRRALEAYLTVVARHPALGRSPVLAAWLCADGVFFDSGNADAASSSAAAAASAAARDTNLSYSAAWQAVAPMRSPTLLEGAARLPRQLAAAALEGGGKSSSSAASSASLGGLPTAAEVGRSAAASGDLLRRLRELGVAVGQMEQGAGATTTEDLQQSESDPTSSSSSSSSSNLPPGEAELRKERRRAEARAAAVATASAAAEKALSAAEASGAALGDFGLALLKLARAEDDSVHARGGRHSPARAALNGPPAVLLAAAADARRAGGAALRGARLSRAAVAEGARVLAPLHDELALAPALAKALREREAALLTCQTVDSELARRRAALEAAGGAGVGEAAAYSTPAIESLRNDVASLEAASRAAAAEYGRVAERNRSELERLGEERRSGLAEAVQGFVAVGTAFEERRAGGWSEVANAAAEAAAEASRGGAPSD